MNQRIKILFPFVAAIVAIVVLMPREGKFKYEVRKGKEWKHRTLVADFDVPLYKTNAELTQERQEILNSFFPYYNNDTTLVHQQIEQFTDNFLSLLKQEKLGSAQKKYLQKTALPILQKEIAFVYSKGIRENHQIAESYLNIEQPAVYIITGHFAQKKFVKETFLPHEALQYLQQNIDTLPRGTATHAEWWSKIDLKQYLKPNLLYNNDLTQSAYEEKMNFLSLTNGMINKGQKIIANGELINDASYKSLESYRREYELRVGFAGNFWLLLIGQILLVSLFVMAIYFYLFIFNPSQLTFKNACFLMSLLIGFFVVSRWIVYSNLTSIYIVPLAVLAIFVFTFLGERLAFFVQVIAILLIANIAPNAYEFIILNLLAGALAICYAKKNYQRSSLYFSTVLIFAAYCIAYIAQLFIRDGNLSELSLHNLFYFFLNAVLIIATYQLVFIFEKIFGYVSNNTLMEITDTNQPLLRLLAEKAPATFQHSLQVANLAETAVTQIGGNPLLVRAGALYHDIGKVENALYFIENQSIGYNPHSNLEPEESAKIIIQHVADGTSLAKKYRLPKIIIDFIVTHHGKSRTRYFFKVYQEQHPDAIDFSAFFYNGSNPFTKEQAVLMLADAVEAASRSATVHTNEAMNRLVDNVVATIIAEKVLDESPLTFNDISTIKNIFKKKLQNVFHGRQGVQNVIQLRAFE